MKAVISLQPVFDIFKNVYAYQIHHKTKDNSIANIENLTLDLIDTLSTVSLNKISNNKPIIVPFTKNLLINDTYSFAPNTDIIIKIHESVVVDDEIWVKLEEISKLGYKIIINGHNFSKENAQLLAFSNFILVDFCHNNFDNTIIAIKKMSIANSIMLLGTNINDTSHYEKTKNNGIALFSGDFLSKPQIVPIDKIAPMKMTYLQLLQKINEPTINFKDIANIISSDVSLSYKTLKLVNSTAFGFKNRIETIHHAVVAIGEMYLKQWISFIAIKEMGNDTPIEVIRISLTRAKMLEKLSEHTPFRIRRSDFFLVGLFSMLDVLLNRPIAEILNDIKINNDIKESIIKRTGVLSGVYKLVLHHEKFEWDKTEIMLKSLRIKEDLLMNAYYDAVVWTNSILEGYDNG
jgi:EAL and modified HD-GYP domain-containing signal transduction protein